MQNPKLDFHLTYMQCFWQISPIFCISVTFVGYSPESDKKYFCKSKPGFSGRFLRKKIENTQNWNFKHLTGECPSVAVRYKQKRTFFNPKFAQFCPKTAKFLPFFKPKIPQKCLGIPCLWSYPSSTVLRYLIWRHTVGKGKGWAYVEFEEESAAAKALLGLDQLQIGDNKISASISNPPPSKKRDDWLSRKEGGAKKKVEQKPEEPQEKITRKTPYDRKTQVMLLPRSVKVQTHGEEMDQDEATQLDGEEGNE